MLLLVLLVLLSYMLMTILLLLLLSLLVLSLLLLLLLSGDEWRHPNHTKVRSIQKAPVPVIDDNDNSIMNHNNDTINKTQY